MSELVLIAGISGFAAKHIALNLLQKGYHIRGTLRTPSRTEKICETLLSMVEMGRALCEAFPAYCEKIPTRALPGFLVRLMANFNPTMKTIVPDIGLVALADTAYVTEMTGVSFRPLKKRSEWPGSRSSITPWSDPRLRLPLGTPASGVQIASAWTAASDSTDFL